jgi:hypothetical protein
MSTKIQKQNLPLRLESSDVERFASNPARFWSLEMPSRVKMNATSGRLDCVSSTMPQAVFF